MITGTVFPSFVERGIICFVFVYETDPPPPKDISAIPLKIICDPRVVIILGSSGKLVVINPLNAPQRSPVPRHPSITTGKGAPALLM